MRTAHENADQNTRAFVIISCYEIDGSYPSTKSFLIWTAEIGGDRRVCLPRSRPARPRRRTRPISARPCRPKGSTCATSRVPSPSRSIRRSRRASPRRVCTSACTTASPNTIPRRRSRFPRLPSDGNRTADNSEFTFHLRDAKWSNGDPITAHDFVYSLRRGLAPEFAARTAYLAYYIKGAQAYNEGKGKAEDVGVDRHRRSHGQVHAVAARALLPGPGRASVLPAGAAQGGRGARPGVDAAAEHRHERRVHPEDVEAVRQARLRPQPALLGRGERQARLDHVLSDRRRDDDDEPVQGGRDRRAVQPHSAGCMDRSSSPHGRSHGQAGVRHRLLHAEHHESADGRRARTQGVQHGDRQGGAGGVSAHDQAADGVFARRYLPGISAAGRRSVRSDSRKATARRGRISRRERQLRSVRRFRSPKSSSPTTRPSAIARSPNTCRRSGSRTSA